MLDIKLNLYFSSLDWFKMGFKMVYLTRANCPCSNRKNVEKEERTTGAKEQ